MVKENIKNQGGLNMIGFYNYTVWLTYISLISGTLGIMLCLYFPDKPILGIFCLMFSGFCDMFDGKVARTKKDRTRQEKDFGIEIDSLTDFGLVFFCKMNYIPEKK